MNANTLKQKIINSIIEVEGGYVNDSNDSGGETNYGITEKVARDYGYAGAMIDLPRSLAFKIYQDLYWNSVRGDDLAEVSERLADEVVDTCVNMGVKRASEFMQRSLNALNNAGSLYSDIVIDGNIGKATIKALKQYSAQQSIDTLIKMLNCLQGAFYVELAERREKDEKFIYGWFNNRVVLK